MKNQELEKLQEMVLAKFFHFLNDLTTAKNVIVVGDVRSSLDSFTIQRIQNDVTAIKAFTAKVMEGHQIWCKEMTERMEDVYKVTKSNILKCYPSNTLTKDLAFRPFLAAKTEDKCSAMVKLLFLSIPDYGFDARMAVFMQQLCLLLEVSPKEYTTLVENYVAAEIKKAALQEQKHDMNAQEKSISKKKKKWLMGLGAVAGGVLIGVTAGLAAPAVIPVVGALFGIQAGVAFLAGTTGMALFTVVFGVGGAKLGQYHVDSRYRDVKDFKFVPVNKPDESRMRISIGVPGWIGEEQTDMSQFWHPLLHPGMDLYYVECEKESLIELGNSLNKMLTDAAIGAATTTALKATYLATAVAAISWPLAVAKAAWTVCMNIAQRGGMILADAIRQRAHGNRPLTLVGFSLGALMIFECLLELCTEVDKHLGVIENVIFAGIPAEVCPLDRWAKIRLLVSGRVVHCFSRSDWILQYVYRGTSLAVGDIAGLTAIQGVEGIENVNMTELITGHTEYSTKMPELIKLVNL